MKKFIGLFLMCWLISCVDEKKEKKTNNKLWQKTNLSTDNGDKLSISYFIQGRIKAVQVIDGVPFIVTVSSINPDLINKNIFINILNTREYQIRFYKNQDTVYYKGKYGEVLTEKEITMQAELNIDTSQRNINAMKRADYFFEINYKKK